MIMNCFYFTAHEITHAFDDVGIQYDSTGSYQPLYDNLTVSQFHEASGKQVHLHPYLQLDILYKSILNLYCGYIVVYA